MAVGETSHARRVGMRDEDDTQMSEQCMITFLGKEMSTSSYAMYSFAAAVLVQAVTLVCFSSFADHGMALLSGDEARR